MITVFTPVYNRKYIIGKLYESLLRQTVYNFEWIIIDDGSEDNLSELVACWKESNPPFEIVYHYVKNGGKHRAINLGVQMARGEAFFIVDSDDFLADDAISFVEEKFDVIASDNRFAGISGLRCSYADGRVLGGVPNFEEYVDATNLERDKYNLLGDKAEVYKTEVLKRFPFPEFEGENFLEEGIVYNRIALCGLKLRWYNKVLYHCEYIADGLTRNIIERKSNNPKGWSANVVLNTQYVYKEQSAIFKERYLFYECMHEKYTCEEMCAMLEMMPEEYEALRSRWLGISEEIRRIIGCGNENLLALYGMGQNAKRLMLYLREMQIPITYGIDRNVERVNFEPMYRLENELPCVRSVCITLANVPAKLKEEIQGKIPKAFVWELAEVDSLFK